MEKIFYLAQIFGGLNAIAILGIIISVIALLVFTIWFCSAGLYDKKGNAHWGREEDYKFGVKWIKRCTIALIVFIVTVIFVPSKKTYLFMVGTHALEEIATNERVQATAGKTLDLLDQYLDKQLSKDKEENETAAE